MRLYKVVELLSETRRGSIKDSDAQDSRANDKYIKTETDFLSSAVSSWFFKSLFVWIKTPHLRVFTSTNLALKFYLSKFSIINKVMFSLHVEMT